MEPWSIGLALLAAAAAGCLVWLLLLPPEMLGEVAERNLSRPSWRTGIRPQLTSLVMALAAGVAGYLLLGLIAPALVLAALGWGSVLVYRRWRRVQEAARLGSALLGAVDLLAQLLPAGHSTRQALLVLAQSGPPEIRDEISAVLSRVDEVPLEQALVEAELRLRQPLFTLIATTLVIGNRSGGRLTPLLSELSRAAHQMDAVQGQLRAEQAQGRLGALVIALLPLGLLGLLHLVNPEYLAPYTTPGGQLLLGGLISLVVAGYVWMLRILRIPEPDLLPLAERALPAPRALAASGGLSRESAPLPLRGGGRP